MEGQGEGFVVKMILHPGRKTLIPTFFRRVGRRGHAWQIQIIVILAAIAAMYPVVSNHFVHWDDPDTIFENPAFNPPSWQSVQAYWDWNRPAGGLYVPLTYTYWAGLAAAAHTHSPGIDGEHLDPHLFHAASLLLHLIAVVLVLTVLRELKFNLIASLCGALIFAVHPLQVEAVAWASGAKDLLCAVFSLVCIWQYLLFTRAQKRAGIFYAIAFLCLLAAMLCKPSAMMAPAILLVLDRFFEHRSWRKIILAILPMAIALVPLMIEARKVQDVSKVPAVLSADRFFVATDALTFYLQKLFLPVRLCVDYGRTPAAAMQSPGFKFEWIIPAAIAIGLIIFRKRIPKLVAAAWIFLLPLLPVLGLTPFMMQAHSTVADHYLYLPMLGVAMAVALLVSRARRAVPIIIAVAAIFIVLSNVQSRTWADSFTLFSHAVKINPNNAPEQGNLGNALALKGDYADAISHLRRSIQINPNNPLPHRILAQVDLQEGKYQEAIDEAQAAISVAPPDENLRQEYLIQYLARRRVTMPPVTAPSARP